MALISQLKGIGQRLKTSTVNLYGAWPQRPSEVLGFVSTRVDLARQRGLRGLTFDTLRTAVNLAVVGEAIVCQAGKTRAKITPGNLPDEEYR